MKNKFILAVFTLIICVSACLGGCAQTVQLTTVYADGSRAYNYTIQLSPSLCQEAGIDSTRAMQIIDENVKSYWTAFSAGRNLAGVNFQAKVNDNDANTYNISWTFNSFEAYLNFYGKTTADVANQPAVYEKGLFVSKSIVEDSNLSSSSDLMLEMQIIPALTTGFINDFATEFFDGDTAKVNALFSKIETNIVRAYPSALKIRSNADVEQQLIGSAGVTDNEQQALYTAYIWNCTLAEPTPHIYIYRNVYLAENRVAWYVLAIVSALIFGLILYAIYYFRNKNQKSDEIIFTSNQPIETTASKIDTLNTDTNSSTTENKDTKVDDNSNKVE